MKDVRHMTPEEIADAVAMLRKVSRSAKDAKARKTAIKAGLTNHDGRGWTEIVGIKKMNSVGGFVGSTTVGYRWYVYAADDHDLVPIGAAAQGETVTLNDAKKQTARAFEAMQNAAVAS